MATVPGQLIWEIVKKNNSFLVKEFGNGTASVKFSKEPNNLYTTCTPTSTPIGGAYNCVTFASSVGLANKKTVTIQAGKDQSLLLATTKTKKQNKPSLLNKSLMKKEFSRMAKAVSNQVADNHYRPDLKKAALARLSVVNRSLKVAKSGVKKRNRQAA
ncbi:UNVERIFIED_CONTAM: 60S ribosomal protein L28-2 [Sesamum calycinum]|uniref:60S ribosomal protein L28-2 n=1 Tax=Sesamum calycinum TaxID=2727403 RepID=A0AAW2NHD5_9LAMI